MSEALIVHELFHALKHNDSRNNQDILDLATVAGKQLIHPRHACTGDRRPGLENSVSVSVCSLTSCLFTKVSLHGFLRLISWIMTHRFATN